MPTIIFDLDGTLVDLWPIERATLVAMFLKLPDCEKKLRPTKLNLLKKSRNDLFKIFNSLFAKYSDKKISKQRFNKLYDETQRSLIKTKTYPKIKKYIDREPLMRLKNKYTLALVTGSRTQELNYVLEATKLTNIFNKHLIICSDTLKQSKSTGIPFKAISKRNPGPIVVIGDSDSDKLGAQKEKIPYVIIKKGKKIKDAIRAIKKYLDD